MEDIIFELLTRIHNEFSSRFDRVEKDIRGLRIDVSGRCLGTERRCFRPEERSGEAWK
ncbi:MAG TPA: hypothetical protein PK127_06810 [Clostridiales bacterium]|nr:hypothetical protein [Clostridiales bacterium]HPV02170.1 hypothetical protein [Clostridiales bacterium]